MDLSRVHCIHMWKHHSETPLYEKYMLMKNEKKILQNASQRLWFVNLLLTRDAMAEVLLVNVVSSTSHFNVNITNDTKRIKRKFWSRFRVSLSWIFTYALQTDIYFCPVSPMAMDLSVKSEEGDHRKHSHFWKWLHCKWLLKKGIWGNTQLCLRLSNFEKCVVPVNGVLPD